MDSGCDHLKLYSRVHSSRPAPELASCRLAEYVRMSANSNVPGANSSKRTAGLVAGYPSVKDGPGKNTANGSPLHMTLHVGAGWVMGVGGLSGG